MEFVGTFPQRLVRSLTRLCDRRSLLWDLHPDLDQGISQLVWRCCHVDAATHEVPEMTFWIQVFMESFSEEV